MELILSHTVVTTLCYRLSEAEGQHGRAISDLKRKEEDRLTQSLEDRLAKEKVTMIDHLYVHVRRQLIITYSLTHQCMEFIWG